MCDVLGAGSVSCVVGRSPVMQTESDKSFAKRSMSPLLLLGLMCLIIVGVHTYLGWGRSISVGRFELNRRNDARWGYQSGKVAAFSPSGAIHRTGDSFSFGPFRVTHWREGGVNR